MRQLVVLAVGLFGFTEALVAAAGAGAVAATPAPEAQAQKPSGLEIFDAALAKFEADRAALRKWQYHQTLTTEQFDSSGKVTARGTWRSIVRPGDPGPLEYTSKHVEGKITFFESGSQPPAGNESSTPASPHPTPVYGKATPGASPSKSQMNQAEWAVNAVNKYNLRNRYDWKRLPDGMAVGEEAYVVAFTPKPHQNTRTREERFFGHLAGKMWVSKRDNTVLKAEGALVSPSPLFWIIARVTVFHFAYEVEPAHGEEQLQRLSKATAQTEVTFPFFKVRQKHWHSVDRYEPRTPRGDTRENPSSKSQVR